MKQHQQYWCSTTSTDPVGNTKTNQEVSIAYPYRILAEHRSINRFFVTSIVFALRCKNHKFSISTMTFRPFTHPTTTSTTRHHSIFYIPNIYLLDWRNSVPRSGFIIKSAGISSVGQCWMVILPLSTTSVTKIPNI